MKTVCRVFAYLKRYPLLAIATLACAIAGTLMVIVPPAATKYVLDNVINGHHAERLVPLLILVAFAMLLQRGLDYLRLLLNNTFEQKVIFDLRRDLYSHIQTLPLRWFDNRATGDLMTRILEDVSSVERVLIDGIEKGTVAVLQIVVVVGGCFTSAQNWRWSRWRRCRSWPAARSGIRSRRTGDTSCTAAPLRP